MVPPSSAHRPEVESSAKARCVRPTFVGGLAKRAQKSSQTPHGTRQTFDLSRGTLLARVGEQKHDKPQDVPRDCRGYMASFDFPWGAGRCWTLEAGARRDHSGIVLCTGRVGHGRLHVGGSACRGPLGGSPPQELAITASDFDGCGCTCRCIVSRNKARRACSEHVDCCATIVLKIATSTGCCVVCERAIAIPWSTYRSLAGRGLQCHAIGLR